MNKRIFILIGIIIIVAAFLRFYKIEPFMTFLGDQGRDAVIAKRIVTFEDFPAIGAPSSVGQVYLGPFYYYLIAPFLLIFNFNPVGLGIGVAFLTILAMIYIAYEMNKEYGGFVTATFLAIMTFSFSLVELSRFSWNPNLLPYFSFIALFFFYKWITKHSWMHAILFGSFLSFAFQLHYLTLLIFVPIGGYYIYTLIKTKKKFNFVKETALAIGAFIFFNAPLILFDLTHDFLNGRSFLRLFTENKITSSDSSYIERLQGTITSFVKHTLQIDSSFITAGLIIGLFILGSIFIVKKQKNLFVTLNIVLVVSYLIIFAFQSSPGYIHYFGPVYLSFYFILSFLVLLIPKRKIQFAVAGLVVLGFALIQAPRYYFLTAQPSNQIERAKIIANSFEGHITKQPIQIVAQPFTETDGHYRYFLELNGYNILPIESPAQAEELYIMCFVADCNGLDDPHWQIAAFQDKAIAETWKSEGVTIFKVIHKPNDK